MQTKSESSKHFFISDKVILNNVAQSTFMYNNHMFSVWEAGDSFKLTEILNSPNVAPKQSYKLFIFRWNLHFYYKLFKWAHHRFSSALAVLKLKFHIHLFSFCSNTSLPLLNLNHATHFLICVICVQVTILNKSTVNSSFLNLYPFLLLN